MNLDLEMVINTELFSNTIEKIKEIENKLFENQKLLPQEQKVCKEMIKNICGYLTVIGKMLCENDKILKSDEIGFESRNIIYRPQNKSKLRKAEICINDNRISSVLLNFNSEKGKLNMIDWSGSINSVIGQYYLNKNQSIVLNIFEIVNDEYVFSKAHLYNNGKRDKTLSCKDACELVIDARKTDKKEQKNIIPDFTLLQKDIIQKYIEKPTIQKL